MQPNIPAAGAMAALVFLACLLMAGCGNAGQEPVELGQAPVAATTVAAVWMPNRGVAAQPDLVLADSGRLLLSWIEPRDEGGHRLMLAQSTQPAAEDPAWNVKQVAEGDDWFVNWADTPHVWLLPDQSLWMHWLRRTGPGRMDYGIDLVRSADGGHTWTTPHLVNLPGVMSDHGFVSFWTHADDRLGIAWLDSRQKAGAGNAAQEDPHAHHSAGAMMLRAAVFDAAVVPIAEWPLDASTCDCCPTAAAMTARGPVVVYRGRSADEIRDMHIVRFDGDQWTSPRTVHEDGWKIPGCPVNGPAVEARGDQVWVAWYTEGDGTPSLRLARSQDAGDDFAPPVVLASGARVLGRVALATTGSEVLVAWLEETEAGQHLLLARLDHALQERERTVVATLEARGRASGNPRLVANDHMAWMVWVDVQDGQPGLRGARIQ